MTTAPSTFQSRAVRRAMQAQAVADFAADATVCYHDQDCGASADAPCVYVARAIDHGSCQVR